MTLFGPLLTPVIWESKGNVPGVTRLVVAYIEKGGAKLMLEGGFLMPVLGVFQKLISSKVRNCALIPFVMRLHEERNDEH